jgi:hypothetical protein
MTTRYPVLSDGIDATLPTPVGVPDGHQLTAQGDAWVAAAPAGGGIDTSLQALPSDGWTEVNGGFGTGSVSAGVATIDVTGVNNTDTVRLHRAEALCHPLAPAFEFVARIRETASPASSVHRGWGIALTTSAFGVGYRVEMAYTSPFGDANTRAQVNTGGGWGGGGNEAAPSFTDGTGWLRLVVSPTGVFTYYGTGVGTTPPTSWNLIHAFTPAAAVFAAGATTRLTVYCRLDASRSGDWTVEFANMAVRSLLGPPT